MKHFLSKNGRTFVRRVNSILMHQNSLNLVVSCNSNEKLMILKRFAWNVLHAICPQKNTINLGKYWLAYQPSNALKLNPQVLMTSWSLPLNFSKGQNTFFAHFARIASFLGRHLTQRSLFVWPRIPRTPLSTWENRKIRRNENSTIVFLFGE